MTTATRRGIIAAATALILLALGAGVGVVVGDALGTHVQHFDLMRPGAPIVAEAEASVAGPGLIATIAGHRKAESTAEAVDAVAATARVRDGMQKTDDLDTPPSAALDPVASTWRDPAMSEAYTGATDTLGLLGAYREMLLEQTEWHRTLAPVAYERWKTAGDDDVERAAAYVAAYERDVDHSAWNLTAAELSTDRDLAMAWAARILLLLALAWVLIGMLSSRTRLVRRPGAAAARAAWLASTRPWRARESTLGLLPLDRWLLLIIPAGLLVATRAIQTSLLSWTHLAVVLGAWLVFALVLRLCVRNRSPYPVMAAIGGVVVLRCVVSLIAVSFTGPGGYWYGFWTAPTLRFAYITVAFALFAWAFVAGAWALSTQVGARRAIGFVLAAVGAGLAIPAFVVALVGLEQALTVWNDQMGLLPWGVVRILGVTTFLEIPPETAWYAAGLGVVIAGVGALLAAKWRPVAAS
ncbi:hypothetical protein AB1K54_14440 [Microbacterium sp. BWT-B31]|uniref:hypothetical protein n=1 Tax=Microbacterium sp. BWT-B31 TaxID=3232072 RepID=UPI0035271238